jgi:hypothetical protein
MITSSAYIPDLEQDFESYLDKNVTIYEAEPKCMLGYYWDIKFIFDTYSHTFWNTDIRTICAFVDKDSQGNEVYAIGTDRNNLIIFYKKEKLLDYYKSFLKLKKQILKNVKHHFVPIKIE